jgi:outer membrane protein assembly factor BamB
MTRNVLATAAVVVLVATCGSGKTAGGDWPQWRGPERTGISRESGLLKQWPAGGPSLAWQAANLGEGYGSVATSGDRLFVQGLRNRQSIVTALNRSSGQPLWSKELGAGAHNEQGPGPRGTPTVDGDRLYVLTENGDLACLKHDGTAVWQRNILKDFSASNISWLISESPLVDGNLVIVSPGGRGAGMVALDKMTGKTVWTAKELNDEAGYASPVVADVHGIRTVMTLTAEAGVGVRLSDGKLMWKYRPAANNTANIATPVFFDNKVFYTSAYGTGGALLGLRAENGEVKAQEIYFTREMQNHHGGVVLLDGYLYGFSGSILTCLEFATGTTAWRNRSVGKGSITYADGHLYVLSEGHTMGLVEATPAAYREKGRFEIKDLGWPSWAHPVVSGGRLYIRNQNTLASYDVRAR